jgi:hypothetical protein
MKNRPPLYWRALWSLPALLAAAVGFVIRGLAWVGVGIVVAALALFFVPWLLSPYMRIARRVAAPTDDELERTARRYARWRAIPVLGAIWRFGDRLSGNAGQKGFDEYRRWRREQDE